MTSAKANNLDTRERLRLQGLDREEIHRLQLAKLNGLASRILPKNGFYAQKLAAAKFPLSSIEQLSDLPFTEKSELLPEKVNGDFANNLTFPLDDYVRFHRTSGTHGRPLVVLDTAEDWSWWIETWQFVLDAADIGPSDRVMMAFSFGPFIGFWSAHDAVISRGGLVVPGGGMSTIQRLELIRSVGATAIFCTPSYALHMADIAAQNDLGSTLESVRCLVVAGEPGGSIPSIRDKIQAAFDARVVDHAGASEIGPWGFADRNARGMMVIEPEFIAEFVSIESGQKSAENELSELVLTNLGRIGMPMIRYRTGDLVRPTWNHDDPCRFVLLDGGVLGRTDDMMIIRGVNIFPSSIEQILREFPEVHEYRMTAFKNGQLDSLKIEVEDELDNPRRIGERLHIRLGLKVDVEIVPIGSLPRFEAKGRRFVDRRSADQSAGA